MELTSDESEDLLLPISFWNNPKLISEVADKCFVSKSPEIGTGDSIKEHKNSFYGSSVKIVRKRKARKGPIIYSDTDDEDITETKCTRVTTKHRKKNVRNATNLRLHCKAGIDANKHNAKNTKNKLKGKLQKINGTENSDLINEEFLINETSAEKDTNLKNIRKNKKFVQNNHCEDENVISEVETTSSIEDLDNSEMEKSFYTCKKKLKISRSRFGAFRRRNYKYGPIIFSDEENKTKEMKENCKIPEENVENSDGTLTARSDFIEDFINKEKTLKPRSGFNELQTDLKNELDSSTDHEIKLIDTTAVSVIAEENPRTSNQNNSFALTKNSADPVLITDAITIPIPDKILRTDHPISVVNNLFFGEESFEIKPPPGKRKLKEHDSITQSPEKHEMTLLDDNSLWSSPKKIKS